MVTFAEAWQKYPRKVGKIAAHKAWTKAVERASPEAILAKLAADIESEWKGRKREYVPHMSTWLHREDFSDPVPSVDDMCERELGLHLCDVCRPAHEWREVGDRVFFADQYLLGCPQARQAMQDAIRNGMAKRK